MGLSFGDYFRFSIVPFVGYKLKPKLHIGGKVGYEYIEDNRYDETLTSHNYGASVFSRVFPRPSIYGHAEFAYMSYKYKVSEARIRSILGALPLPGRRSGQVDGPDARCSWKSSSTCCRTTSRRTRIGPRSSA